MNCSHWFLELWSRKWIQNTSWFLCLWICMCRETWVLSRLSSMAFDGEQVLPAHSLCVDLFINSVVVLGLQTLLLFLSIDDILAISHLQVDILTPLLDTNYYTFLPAVILSKHSDLKMPIHSMYLVCKIGFDTVWTSLHVWFSDWTPSLYSVFILLCHVISASFSSVILSYL